MNQVDNFLRQTGVHPEITDIGQLTELFIQDMENGLEGRKSSLHMIPSYIGEDFCPVPGEAVLAVDAGGTNLRISRVRFEGEGLACAVEEQVKIPMPGSRGAVDTDEFFDVLAGHMAALVSEIAKIGFTFSFPVEILPDRDGRVLSLNKEVVVHNIGKETISRQLGDALSRRGRERFQQLTALNDTTASLLGGRNVYRASRQYSSYIGFVLGTGTNSCYYECNSAVGKSPALAAMPGKSIINLESGFFDKMPRGSLDEHFVKKTLIPGDSWLEKMTSGQYLGPLMLEYLRAAARAEVLSPQASASVQALPELSAKDVGDFLAAPGGGNLLADLRGLTGEDSQSVFLLADALLERAAKIVAANVSACALKSGAGTDPLRPIQVVFEGTTYYKTPSLRQKVEYHLQHFLQREQGIYVHTVQVEDVVTYGTAFAAVCK